MNNVVSISGLIVCAVVLVVGFVSETTAQPKFTSHLSTDYNLGETEYILDVSGFDSLGQRLRIKSQLEYPLDVFMLGGGVSVVWDPQNPLPWDSKIGVSFNLNDPGGAMADRDWTNEWQGVRLNEFTEVSSTESSAEMNSVTAFAEFGKTVVANPGLQVRLFAGYRYQRIDQELYGLEGWQLSRVVGTDSLRLLEFDIEDIKGLTYEVTFHMPHAGLEATLPFGGSVALSGKAAYAPVIASDKDEHLLRNFQTQADITGHGVIGGAVLRFFPEGPGSGKPFIALTGSFTYLTASGTKTQTWYGNEIGRDPDTGEEIIVVEAGTRISGIPHDINSTQGQIGIELGVGL